MATTNTQAETTTIVCPSCTAGKVEVWGVGHVIGYELCVVCHGSGRVAAPLASAAAVAIFNRKCNAFAFATEGTLRVNIAADLLRERAPELEALVSALENAAMACSNDSFNAGIEWAVAEFPSVLTEFVIAGGEGSVELLIG